MPADQTSTTEKFWQQLACIEAIFSQRFEPGTAGLAIYPNYSELKTMPTKEDEKLYKGVAAAGGVESKRGAVSAFSRKSRSRLIKLMASLYEYPQIWQDFTFADDVMVGKTIEERAEYSSAAIKDFKRQISRVFPKMSGIWRREWEPRKSGQLKGEQCPHFHVMLHMPNFNRKKYVAICMWLAKTWVKCTGSKHKDALKVATNKRSYRLLNDIAMAQRYVSKYVAKVEEHKVSASKLATEKNDKLRRENEKYGVGQLCRRSRGRFWGKLGKLPTCPAVFIPLPLSNEIKLREKLTRLAAEREKVDMEKGKERKAFKLSDIFSKLGVAGNCWMLMKAREMLEMIGDINGVGVAGIRRSIEVSSRISGLDLRWALND